MIAHKRKVSGERIHPHLYKGQELVCSYHMTTEPPVSVVDICKGVWKKVKSVEQEKVEEWAEIEDGDSNEVCLAKTTLALIETIDNGLYKSGEKLEPLMKAGAIYASEVLSARE